MAIIKPMHRNKHSIDCLLDPSLARSLAHAHTTMETIVRYYVMEGNFRLPCVLAICLINAVLSMV